MHLGHLLQSNPEMAAQAVRALSDPDRPFPLLSAKLKLTWRCNLRCGLCSIRQDVGSGEGQDPLSVDLIKQTLRDLRREGLKKIHFSGGEPLLYRGLEEIVLFARRLDLQVNMTTNGTLLDKSTARFLVESRVHGVNVSIDSGDETQHDRMRGMKGAWRMAWRGIEHLRRRREKKGRGPVIAVNTILTRRNLCTLDALYQRLRDQGVDRWRLLPVDTEKKSLRPTEDQWTDLIERLPRWKDLLSRIPLDPESGNIAREARRGRYAGTFYEDRPCFAPWFHLFVDADGRTYPCCMGKRPERSYGSILDTPLDEMLSGRRRRETRCSMASGYAFEMCRGCDDFLEENLALWNLSQGGRP
jgi:radical SAM protein with 4Fe4S-binding SPASM domain